MGAYMRHKLPHEHRLGHAVAGAKLKPLDATQDLAGGQQQEKWFVQKREEPAAELPFISGPADAQDHQVWLLDPHPANGEEAREFVVDTVPLPGQHRL